MTSKECEEQLKSLVEAWDLNEACLNATDIEAIKHLMLENQMQHKEIKGYQAMYFDKVMIINKAIECIEKVLNSYKENPENALGLNIIGLLKILKEDNKEVQNENSK